MFCGRRGCSLPEVSIISFQLLQFFASARLSKFQFSDPYNKSKCKYSSDTRNKKEIKGFARIRVIIDQVKQKLHLVGYLPIQYYKDARYHEYKMQVDVVKFILVPEDGP